MVPFILFPAGKILDGQTVDVGVSFLWNPACFFYFYFSIEPPFFLVFSFHPEREVELASCRLRNSLCYGYQVQPAEQLIFGACEDIY